MSEKETQLPREPVSIVRVIEFNDLRVKDAIDIVVDAFHDDIMAHVMVGEGNDSLRLPMQTCIAAGAIISGRMYVALDADNVVVGTASWFPAGTDFGADEKQRAAGMDDFLKALSVEKPKVYEWWTSVFFPFLATFPPAAYASANFPNPSTFKLDNYTLVAFAVRPDLQRRGIGKALLQVVEAQAAADGLSVNIETADAGTDDWKVLFYERCGYKRVDSAIIQGMEGDVGCRVHALVKTPSRLNNPTQPW